MRKPEFKVMYRVDYFMNKPLCKINVTRMTETTYWTWNGTEEQRHSRDSKFGKIFRDPENAVKHLREKLNKDIEETRKKLTSLLSKLNQINTDNIEFTDRS